MTALASIALALVVAVQAEPPSPPRASGAEELRALFAEAVRLQQARDLERAADAYRRFLKDQPRNVEALSNLGAVLSAQGRYEEAIARYGEALLLDARRTAVRLNLAVALQKAGRPAQAVVELERVVAERPDQRHAIVLLAESRAQLGEYGTAAALLMPLHDANPEDRAVAYLLGLSLVQNKQVDRGKVVLDRVLRDGDSAEARLLMGAVQLGAGEHARARDDFRRAAERNPDLPMVHGLLGRALMNLGDTTSAAQELRRELAVNPNDFDANLLLGVLLRQDNALDEAMARFDKAVALRPGDPAALYQIGSLRLQLGQTESARDALERVVAATPDFLQAHVSLATAYYRLKRKADGDRHHALAQELERKVQAQQPGAQAGGEAYRGEPAPPTPERKEPPNP